MKHTKYLAAMIKQHGVPQLSNDSFSKMMNVVHLEGAISSLKKIRIGEREEKLKHRYFLQEVNLQDKLDDITLHREPNEFYKFLHGGDL